MKCPQLNKPEATAARKQNSIGDRMDKKTLRETRFRRRRGSAVLLWPDEQVVQFQAAAQVRLCRGPQKRTLVCSFLY